MLVVARLPVIFVSSWPTVAPGVVACAPKSPPDEALAQRLSLPLAQLYRRAHNAKTARDRHLTAFYLWHAALKLLASAAAPPGLRTPRIGARTQVELRRRLTRRRRLGYN